MSRQEEVVDRFHWATDKWIEALQELARVYDVDPGNAVEQVDRLRVNICRRLKKEASEADDYYRDHLARLGPEQT